MLFSNKQYEQFDKLLKQAYSNLKEKNFDAAIALYNKIHESYLNLPEKYKTEKLKKDVEVLYKELTLYMRINEAYIQTQKGNLQGLQREISDIHEMVYDLKSQNSESAKPLLEYTQKHYKFFLDVYSYKLGIKDFNDKYEEILSLLEESELEDAVKEFSELIIAYKKLLHNLDSDKRLEFYSKLKELYQQISIKKALKLSIQKPKVLPGKPIVQVQPKIKQRKQEEIKEEKKLDNNFSKLHDLIKKGDYSKAVSYYEDL